MFSSMVGTARSVAWRIETIQVHRGWMWSSIRITGSYTTLPAFDRSVEEVNFSNFTNIFLSLYSLPYKNM